MYVILCSFKVGNGRTAATGSLDAGMGQQTGSRLSAPWTMLPEMQDVRHDQWK